MQVVQGKVCAFVQMQFVVSEHASRGGYAARIQTLTAALVQASERVEPKGGADHRVQEGRGCGAAVLCQCVVIETSQHFAVYKASE